MTLPHVRYSHKNMPFRLIRGQKQIVFLPFGNLEKNVVGTTLQVIFLFKKNPKSKIGMDTMM